MKSNEAPENNKRKAPDKIYACFGVFGLIQATEIKATSKDIEYVRKDAFIEKACVWLKNNLQGIVGGSIYMEDFRKYMEGE